MPSLPPRITSDLFYDGVWNDITYGLSQTESIEITRGTTSEGNQPDPNEGSALLQNATGNFSPKNPNSSLYGKIGRNTPIRFNVDAGKPWLQIPDTNDGSRARTPDNNALDITGDIDVRVEAQLENWNNGSITELCNKQQITADQRSWRFLQLANGTLEFTWTTLGTAASGLSVASSEVLRVPPNARVALRATLDVNNGAGGYTVTFYTAPTIAGPWTQFGNQTVTTAGTTSIFSSTSPLDVGDTDGIILGRPVGRFYAFQLRNGINGTLVANADFTNLAVGTTAWTDSVGRTWSVQNSASISNTHSRLVGEVPAWPPNRTTSGHVTVPIAPAGILRRLGSGAKPLKSAAFRSITFNSPDSPILEYWPWEDGSEATAITSGLNGGPNASIKGDIDLSSQSVFASSAPLPTMNKGTVTANVRSYTTSASAQVRFFLSVPSGGTTNNAVICRVNCSGTARAFNLIYTTGGALQVQMVDGDNVEIDSTGPILFDVNGRPMRFSIGLTQVGANVQVTMGSLVPNAAFANVLVDTLNGATFGRVTSITLGTASGLGQTSIGHVTFQRQETNLFDIVEQLDAYAGETAGNRIVRLCAENGIIGAYNFSPLSSQVTLGPQRIKTLIDLLTEAATADQGFLLEARDALEIQYRSLTTMYNQLPGIVLDYSNGVISPPFQPVDDDKLTRNSVVVTVDGGSSSSPAVLETGRMSIQDPPDGVGLYDVEYTYSLENLGLAESLAGWLLRTGTFDGLRYTKITLNLANDRVAAFATDIFNVDVGDMIRLTNLPDDLPPDDVDLIVIGYNEVMGPSEWKISFICIPGDPYQVGATQPTQDSMEFATNANDRADLEGVTTYAALDNDDTNLPVLLASGSLVPWAMAYPVLSVNPAMKTSLANWSAQGGSLVYDVTPDFPPFDQDMCARFVSDGVSTTQSIINSGSAAGSVKPALTYFANGWIYSDTAIRARIAANWHNSSGTYISTTSGSTIAIAANTWTYLSASLLSPALADRVAVHFSLDDSGGSGSVPISAKVYGAQPYIRRQSVASQFGYDPETYPLDLRVAGEVVRATSCMPGFYDSFTRTTASSWGTSESGHVYSNTGGSAGDFSTDATTMEGRHTCNTVNVSRFSVIDNGDLDCDMFSYVQAKALSTGGSQYGVLVGRFLDGSNYYSTRVDFRTDGFITLSIRKRVAAVETELISMVTAQPHVAGRNYGVRLYIRGTAIKAQFWDSSLPQATDRKWDLEATDSDLTTGTGFGLRSIVATGNTNVAPVIAYAYPRNLYPQMFIVDRSINGVVKALPIGSDVNVEKPFVTTAR
jgi:hypothetical protein